MFNHRTHKHWFIGLLTIILAGCTTLQPAAQTSVHPPAVIITAEIQQSSSPEMLPVNTPASPAEAVVALLDPASPHGIVESFYTGYLQDSATVSPLVSGTYRDNPYLSDYLIDITRQMLDREASPQVDPFTCRADAFESFQISAVYISGGLARALVMTGPGGDFLNVNLTRDNDGWKIDAVECGGTPAATVVAFYTWYLSYPIGDADAQEMPELDQNALADRAYASSPFLTAGLVKQIDQLLVSSLDMGGGDPFIGAQALPIDFSVVPAQAGSEIVLKLIFGPQSARYLQIHTTRAENGWLIDSITPREIPVFDPAVGANLDRSGWKEFVDLAHGISFSYPPEWSASAVQKSALRAPYELSVQFSRSGKLWLTLDVLRGAEDELSPFLVTESRQRVEMDGKEIFVERHPGFVRYRLQHPAVPDVWFAFTDSISEPEASTSENQNLEAAIAALLDSIQFRD